jgi:hypothetical protein
MSATTAVTETAAGRLGVMVRTAAEIFIYWYPPGVGAQTEAGPNTIRISDMTGRPAAELLDGQGYRDLEAATAIYVPNLQPGHLYFVEAGRRDGEGFHPVIGVGPVQTPWLGLPDQPAFPAPYHRS